MIKIEELNNPQSCLNRALHHEYLFVGMARDEAAPVMIRAWIAERLRLGKNQPKDQQIVSAEYIASQMEKQRMRGEFNGVKRAG